MTIPNTDRLLRGNIGVARAEMPQLGFMPEEGTRAYLLPRDPNFGGVDLGPMFWGYMADQAKMEYAPARVVKLRATQNEINCEKVAALVKLMEKGKLAPQCLFCARDGYIVDGHHRWAAELVLGARRRDLMRRSIMTSRIDLPIREVIVEAHRFCEYWMGKE